MTLKEFVLAKIKPDDYYASRFPRWNPRVRGNVKCVFHNDSSPSLAISLRNGGAHCHASTCAKSIANIVHFESSLKNESETLSARRLYREFIRKVISSKTVAEYRQNLCVNQNYMLKIKREMGLLPPVQRRFGLGLDLETKRIVIPVYDAHEQVVNLRFYRLPSERKGNDDAKIYNLKGYGGLDLFPYPPLATLPLATPLYFMASEKEAMLAISLGLNAFTTTTGEGSWNPDWNSLFKDRTVHVVFDRDEGGQAASTRICKELATIAKVEVVDLPFKSKRKDYKDFADWILKEKHHVKEIQRFTPKPTSRNRTTVPTTVSQFSESTSSQEVPPSGHASYPELPEFAGPGQYDLSKISSRSELLNKRIRTQGIVAAKSSNTYSIPWKFRINIKNREAFEFALPMGRHLLMFIRSTDGNILQSLQKLVGHAHAEIEPLAFLTATEVELIPTAVIDQDVPYVVQRCYYFGNRIESNIPYYLEVIPTSEIRSQETIGIITSYIPLSKSIDKFELTDEVFADLTSFWAEGGDVWNKLTTLAHELSINYTRVYHRLDWHLVALLTWASPIGFRFPGDSELQRGWINSLALGDTETGKSKVAKKLRELFQCGVFVNAENCTYVGLVGGAIKMGSGQLMLRWGRIPLSDKQLVILEELSGLSVPEIANMSDVRSGGIARLDKGGINSETNARTRLLCLSNVRSERKNLSNYLFGVRAIQELIGHGEDIARFDLITTLTDREVSNDIINAGDFATNAKDVGDGSSIRPDQLQKLIHLIWSLTPEQIHFTSEAYDACLTKTKELAAVYHPSIPIFKGGSGRYKLGRIAAAIACLQFAWNSEAKRIEILPTHVEAACTLLQRIYDKQSFGYLKYSTQEFKKETIGDTRAVRLVLAKEVPTARLSKVLNTIIHMSRFNRDELCAVFGIYLGAADKIISTMVNEHIITKGDANMWEITPPGKFFLEKIIARYKNAKT